MRSDREAQRTRSPEHGRASRYEELMRRAIRAVAAGERACSRVPADRVARDASTPPRPRIRRARAVAGHGRSRGGSASEAIECLRVATSAFARHYRNNGRPAEEMLERIKDLLRQLELTEELPSALRQLRTDVIRWSVEAYYALC